MFDVAIIKDTESFTFFLTLFSIDQFVTCKNFDEKKCIDKVVTFLNISFLPALNYLFYGCWMSSRFSEK